MHLDPIGIFETNTVPIALSMPCPPSAATMTIEADGETLVEVNLAEKLLNDAIDLIPD